MAEAENGGLQLRQPRLAEMVADILRERILSGSLGDGDSLPKQEDLLAEFNVSKPSIREALRILETEGLVTVRRGNVGGAVVHVPKAHNAAYTLGLVLQARQVSLRDVGLALRHIEPLCAALCAEQADRGDLVARLQVIQRETAQAAVDDEIAFVHHARRFHEELVLSCGNETMKLVVGALEDLWSAQETMWAMAAAADGEFYERAQREAGVKAHERILSLIERGSPEDVQRIAYRHLARSQVYALSGDGSTPVDATTLRRAQPS